MRGNRIRQLQALAFAAACTALEGGATVVSDRVAIYPGSFDPPTNGHLDIVERSARLFDRVVVGVGRNLMKKTVFDADERIGLMRDACRPWKNVETRAFE